MIPHTTDLNLLSYCEIGKRSLITATDEWIFDFEDSL